MTATAMASDMPGEMYSKLFPLSHKELRDVFSIVVDDNIAESSVKRLRSYVHRDTSQRANGIATSHSDQEKAILLNAIMYTWSKKATMLDYLISCPE